MTTIFSLNFVPNVYAHNHLRALLVKTQESNDHNNTVCVNVITTACALNHDNLTEEKKPSIGRFSLVLFLVRIVSSGFWGASSENRLDSFF